MIDYGKFIAVRRTETDEETGISYDILVFENPQGVDWHIVSKDNPSAFYCALTDNDEIIFAADEADNIQIDGYRLIGVDTLNGYTFGHNGTIYGKIWNGSAVVEPPISFPNLTARQLRLGLLSLGKLNEVPAAIAALQEPEKSQAEIEWQFASEFRRDHPLIVQLIPILALTDEQVDTVWLEYASV